MISNKADGVNTPTLTISSVTQDDEDEYYCTASYGVYVNGTSHVAESEKAKVVVFGKITCIRDISIMCICAQFGNLLFSTSRKKIRNFKLD